MPTMSLREAATAAGTSKSTILRAIKSGRLSAARLDDGGYAIDPAELHRVYPLRTGATVPDRSADRSVGQDAPVEQTPDATVRTGAPPWDSAMVHATAVLEAELRALKALLDAERERRIAVEADRDRWAAQAERLALAPPARPWWRRITG